MHHFGKKKKKVKERKPSGKSNALPQTDNFYSLGNYKARSVNNTYGILSPMSMAFG